MARFRVPVTINITATDNLIVDAPTIESAKQIAYEKARSGWVEWKVDEDSYSFGEVYFPDENDIEEV